MTAAESLSLGRLSAGKVNKTAPGKGKRRKISLCINVRCSLLFFSLSYPLDARQSPASVSARRSLPHLFSGSAGLRGRIHRGGQRRSSEAAGDAAAAAVAPSRRGGMREGGREVVVVVLVVCRGGGWVSGGAFEGPRPIK